VPPPCTGGQEFSQSESVVQAPHAPPVPPELEVVPLLLAVPPLLLPELLLSPLLLPELLLPELDPPSRFEVIPPDELVVPPSSVRPKPPPFESPCPQAENSATARRPAETEISDETLIDVLPVLPAGVPPRTPPGVFALCLACSPA
jgi:hypothetical protein